MSISYKKLRQLLINRELNKKDLQKMSGVSTRLHRENVDAERILILI